MAGVMPAGYETGVCDRARGLRNLNIDQKNVV